MNAVAIYVAYGVDSLDLSWIPDDAEIVIVHNDDRLSVEASAHPGVRRLHPGRNVGFGAAVNLALATIDADRVVLCNPDTRVDRAHWTALATAAPDEVVTVEQFDDTGAPTSVVNGYWNLPAFLGTAFRLGRFIPRGGTARRLVTRLLGSWGRTHQNEADARHWPLASHWASGALLSMPLAPITAVGGFDERFFLYYEDADLQQRMAVYDPSLRLRLADVEPAIHTVGATAGAAERDEVGRIRRESAAAYAASQHGIGWTAAARLVGRRAR